MIFRFLFLLLPLHLCACGNFLVILVDAPHLDYTNTCSFFKTMAKHPSNFSKNGDVGHAWIYLVGTNVELEGGHSGELGQRQARYFQGIMNYIDYGYANPTQAQKMQPSYEPNPCKYLWAALDDGYFEAGAGGHIPTYAASVELTDQQLASILNWIFHYDFSKYTLTNHQCCTFVSEVAGLAGLHLDSEVTLPIAPQVLFEGEVIRFWSDPNYSSICFQSPDRLEGCLKELVRCGLAAPALDWYRQKRKPRRKLWRDLCLFPSRWKRALAFRNMVPVHLTQDCPWQCP